ncbi:ROK family protein [Massilia sp. TSP1-1-2]|uniref:ROK family protein n=1 Tax=unclassified Massilia TaxID=2609279 RepID=UPI003CEAE845
MSGAYIVLDMGGTTLRSALYDPASGVLSNTRREPTDNFIGWPELTLAQLQDKVFEQLQRCIAAQRACAPAAAACISFAGPVAPDGRVVGAPTIWGKTGAPLALGARLSAALDMPVHLLNDVTAAAWRYSEQVDEPFCLITVSSGIGNKVYYDGQTLVNGDGFGGEIGHLRVDFGPDAPLCDCGERGHLGALASGRGTLEVARRFALADPDAFAASLLARLCGGEADAITTYHLVEAAKAGDAFAAGCVRHGIGFMARAIATIYAAIGVRRYLFMGGFALALGELYHQWLAAELRTIGLFGVAPEAVADVLEMTEEDDDHGLTGAGRYLRHTLAHQERETL